MKNDKEKLLMENEKKKIDQEAIRLAEILHKISEEFSRQISEEKKLAEKKQFLEELREKMSEEEKIRKVEEKISEKREELEKTKKNLEEEEEKLLLKKK